MQKKKQHKKRVLGDEDLRSKEEWIKDEAERWAATKL